MGKTLTTSLIDATGLPKEPVEREFNALLAKHNLNPETLTMDELREVMSEYLQSVFMDLLESQQ